MNVSTQITQAFPNEIDVVQVNKKTDLHGQNAVEIRAVLVNGKVVEGKFTTESLPGFGGVEFDTKKNIAALMIAKINSVLKGTAE